MSGPTFDPPTPKTRPAGGFSQAITLRGNGLVGILRWHAAPDADGLFQLVDLRIAPAHQRRGHGGTLLHACYAAASEVMTPRRVWAIVRQKSHVNGRAFLTKHGFHQTAMLTGLTPDEALLVYSRAFD